MVKPILCYASQIWGYEYCELIVSVHINFCKKLLGLNSSVNNCMVLGECGRYPLSVTYQLNCIKYWCKIIHMEDKRYPKQCYNMLKSLDNMGRITWASKIKNLLFESGFGIVWINQNVGDVNQFLSKFQQHLKDCAQQNWTAKVNNSSRCQFYKHFKSDKRQ